MKVCNYIIKNNKLSKQILTMIYIIWKIQKNAVTKISRQPHLKADLNIDVQNLHILRSCVNDKIISWNIIEYVFSFLIDCKDASRCVVF